MFILLKKKLKDAIINKMNKKESKKYLHGCDDENGYSKDGIRVVDEECSEGGQW